MAYVTGVVKTIRLVVVGIVLATVIGLLAGIARLSSNWLVSRLASRYVETIRNTRCSCRSCFGSWRGGRRRTGCVLRDLGQLQEHHLISLWKDTTLFSILSFTDALGGAQAAIAQADFIGRQKEVLLFVAFGMSRLSHRLERALGVGVR